MMAQRDLLLGSFQAALAAADPLKIVGAHLPKPPKAMNHFEPPGEGTLLDRVRPRRTLSLHFFLP